MSKNGYSKPALMRKLEVEYWSSKPLETTEHEMSTFFDEDVRCAAAIYRCSYCYPHNRKLAVRPKLRNGTFEDWVRALHERISKRRPITSQEIEDEVPDLDDDGNPVMLSNKDLCLILGMKHPNVSRGIALARAKGVVAEGFPYYYVAKPSAVPPDESRISTDTKLDQLTLLIADLSISIDTTIASPDAVLKAKTLQADWKEYLNSGRQKFRTPTRELSTEPGIIIGFFKTSSKRRGRGEKKENAPPSAAPPQSPPPPPAAPAASGNGAAAAPAQAQATSQTNGNGHPNGNGHGELVRIDPEVAEKQECYERLRSTFQLAGRPVSLDQHLEAGPIFSAFPLSLCRRIAEDASIRQREIWQHEKNLKWVPTFPEYLRKQEWKNPVAARAAAPGQYKTAAEKRNEMAERLMREAHERDRQKERERQRQSE